MTKKPVVLAILDGYGMSSSTEGNAVYTANTPNLDRLTAAYPTIMRQWMLRQKLQNMWL